MNLADEPALIQAIFCCDVAEVRRLLNSNADVNQQDWNGHTALHAAAYVGDAEIADTLLLSGAHVNKTDQQFLTPLHRACRNRKVDVVEVLLRHKVDVSKRDRNFQSALHVCAANDAFECAEFLLLVVTKDAVNAGDRQGMTPLHHAAFSGNVMMLRKLLEYHADVESIDKMSRKPIHWAAFRGDTHVFRTLLEHRADCRARDKNGWTPLHCAAANGMVDICDLLITDDNVDVNCVDKEGNTPLHVACNNGKEKVARFLLDAEADVTARNNVALTPLHYAAASTDGTQCMELLLEHQANVDARALDQRAPIHMAAMFGRFARIETLVTSGAAVDAIDELENTALHEASLNGNELLIKKLHANGSNVNKIGQYYMTPLHLAAYQGYIDPIKSLIDFGANLMIKDEFGRTPLHMAAFSQNTQSKAVGFLIEAGANVLAADKQKRIPLHNACFRGNHQAVKALLEKSSTSFTHCDALGRMPLHYAAWSVNDTTRSACVKLLLRHGASAECRDDAGYLPVHYAADRGSSDTCELLLDGVTVLPCSLRPNHIAVTHVLALRGRNQLLKTILDKFDAQLSNIAASSMGSSNMIVGFEKDSRGRTPLHVACAKGMLECTKILFNRLIKIKRKRTRHVFDYRGLTAYHLAAAHGNDDCLKCFPPAVLTSLDSKGRDCLSLATSAASLGCVNYIVKKLADDKKSSNKQFSDLDTVDKDGAGCVHRAAALGYSDVCLYLLDVGQNASKRDRRGRTPLHYATLANKSVHVLVEALKRQSQEDECLLEDSEGATPIHWAAVRGNDESLALLLSCVKGSLRTPDIYPPMCCAVMTPSTESVRLLLERRLTATSADVAAGFDVNASEATAGRTALHLAAALGNCAIVDCLLRAGADPNSVDRFGWTPLFYAVTKNHLPISEQLIGNGANLWKKDRNGNNSLHLACLSNNQTMIKMIVKKAGDDASLLNEKNGRGQTALHLAARNGALSATERLLLSGADVWTTDADDRLPLIGCAPSESVAKCMEIMLAMMMPDPSDSLDNADELSARRNSQSSPSSSRLSASARLSMLLAVKKRARSTGNFQMKSMQHTPPKQKSSGMVTAQAHGDSDEFY